MRWMLIFAVLVGCDPCSCEPSAEIKARAAELSSGFKKNTDVIVSKQDETLTALAAIKSQVESLSGSVLETRQAVGTMEASLVKSNPNGKESDPASALEPQEAKRPNQSQPLSPVGVSPAVRLFVTHAPFHCPPCERLKAAVSNGEFDGFEVTDVGDFSGLRSYPAIRFETPKTTTGWGVVYGYDSSTIPTLRAMTQGTSAPATGAIFPLQTANHVTGSRSSFRSVSRWLGHDRGQRTTTRTAFRSGSSP